MKKQNWITVCAALLILLFIYNCFDKLSGFKIFGEDIDNQPLPNSWTPFIIVSIPALEILIIVALLFRRTEKVGFYAAAILLTLFSGYIGAILLHAFSYVPYSCAGVIYHMGWGAHFFLNLFFIGVAVTGIILRKQLERQPA
jgi:putative oxidoreductase